MDATIRLRSCPEKRRLYSGPGAAIGIRKPQRETVQRYRARHKQVEERLNALQARLEEASPSG